MTKQSSILEQSGQGPALLLLLGFGMDQWIWKRLHPLLIPHYTVYVLDFPGFGKHPLMDFNSLADIAQWLLDVLEMEMDEPPIVVGHSMGGYVAMELLRLAPQWIRCLCLLHSHVFADGDEKIALRQKAIRFLHEYGTRAYLRHFIPPLFAPVFQKQESATIQKLIDRYAKTRSGVLAAYLQAIAARPDTSKHLAAARMPVQLIAGTADAHVTYTMNLKQGVKPSMAQFVKLEGVAHMGMMEQPGEVANAISGLLPWLGVLGR